MSCSPFCVAVVVLIVVFSLNRKLRWILLLRWSNSLRLCFWKNYWQLPLTESLGYNLTARSLSAEGSRVIEFDFALDDGCDSQCACGFVWLGCQAKESARGETCAFASLLS